MSIIGFNFTKIDVEKKKKPNGNISIKNNLSIKDIKHKDMHITREKAAFEASFDYQVDYLDDNKSKFGKINLQGSLIYLGEKKLIDSVVKEYKKKKSVKPEIVSPLLNYAFNKCTLQSLLLSREVSLPTPIQLPRLKVGGKE